MTDEKKATSQSLSLYSCIKSGIYSKDHWSLVLGPRKTSEIRHPAKF